MSVVAGDVPALCHVAHAQTDVGRAQMRWNVRHAGLRFPSLPRQSMAIGIIPKDSAWRRRSSAAAIVSFGQPTSTYARTLWDALLNPACQHMSAERTSGS